MVAANWSSALMIARSWLWHIAWPCAVVWFMVRTYAGLSDPVGLGDPGAGPDVRRAYLVSGTASFEMVPFGLVMSTQCGACGVS